MEEAQLATSLMHPFSLKHSLKSVSGLWLSLFLTRSWIYVLETMEGVFFVIDRDVTICLFNETFLLRVYMKIPLS